MDYREVLRALQDSPDKVVGRGATASEVEAAETMLACRLPNDYKMFLQWFGWGGRDAWEIFGLGPDVPTFLNLVDVTLEERSNFEPRLPAGLLPIMNDGGANLYCLALNETANGIATVVAWDSEGNEEQSPQRVSPSFAKWFAELIG